MHTAEMGAPSGTMAAAERSALRAAGGAALAATRNVSAVRWSEGRYAEQRGTADGSRGMPVAVAAVASAATAPLLSGDSDGDGGAAP